MSEYEQFLKEKEKIDHYFEQGFEIYSVIENLSGTLIEFASSKDNGSERVEVLLTTAEARKYIATRLLRT